MERQSAPPRPRVCVISPCFNEVEAVPHFHAALMALFDAERRRADWHALYIDDGSSDGTLAALDRLAAGEPRASVLALARNFGQQAALSAGLRFARGDAIVMMDSDLQHPPELLPKLLDAWQAGHDLVWADRQRTEDAGWWKRATSSGFHWLFNRLSSTALPTGAADFCLLSRRAARALAKMPERRRFLRGMVAWLGFPHALVPYVAPARFSGESKYTMRRMLLLAQDAALSFTGAPAKIVGRLGATFMALALATMPVEAVAGGSARWLELAASLAILLQGATLLALGVLGEYVVRIYDEAKARPLYVLRRKFGPRPFAERASRRQAA